MSEWKTHEIQQLNGRDGRIKLPAKLQIVTEHWNGPWNEEWGRVAAVPNITYIPEKDRVLMTASCGNPHQAVILASDDHGATWSEPRYMHTDGSGKGDAGFVVGIAYMAEGRVLSWTYDYPLAELGPGQQWTRWSSEDYGETWTRGEPMPLQRAAPWDPPMVERDPDTGAVTKMWETAYIEDHEREVWSQSYLRCSEDQGRTWSDFREIPEWSGTNEVHIVRAANGNLVAAHRTDMPEKCKVRDPETGEVIRALDLYEGLGVSTSRDNGRTWSAVQKLYDWGRHHFSMVVLPGGDIVLTYASRMGYVETPEGYPQFGVEAVVSRDHGETWDLDHRYLFAAWPGNRTDAKWSWTRCSQTTSSVLLPDGSILTAFGTGHRASVPEDRAQHYNPRDVGLVNWRVNDEGLNDDRTIADAPFDSDLRNRFDPQLNSFE